MLRIGSNNNDTATQAGHTPSRPLLPFLLMCMCVRTCCASARPTAHMCLCILAAPVQLVTLAQRVAPRNTADVQMFLLGKTNKTGAILFGTGGTVKIRAGPPPKQGLRYAGHSWTSPIGGEARGWLFGRMFVQPAFVTHKSFTRDFMCVCSRAPPPPAPTLRHCLGAQMR